MVELTSVLSAVMGLGAIYWLLAFAAVGAAAYLPQGRRRKATAVAVVTLLFWLLPAKLSYDAFVHARYARAAWAHFKKLCAENAGEKVYKNYSGVKSVLIIKPLPPATDQDHFNQFWYGNPYSAPATSLRSELAAARLAWADGPISRVKRGPGFEFVESVLPSNQGTTKFVKYIYPAGAKSHTLEDIEKPVSDVGISWEDISSPQDRHFWVAGSRLRVIDLKDNSLIAERIGYFIEAGFGSKARGRRPWLTSRGPTTTCPEAHDYMDRWFVLNVLQPASEKQNGRSSAK